MGVESPSQIEQLRKTVEQIGGHQIAMEYFFVVGLLEQGPAAIDAFLRSTERSYHFIKPSSEEEEAIVGHARDKIEEIRKEMERALNLWPQHRSRQEAAVNG